MEVLLLFCMPLIFTASISTVNTKKQYVFAYVSGIVIAVLLITVMNFFSFFAQIPTDTIGHLWLYYAIFDTIIPISIMLAVYLLFTRFFSHASYKTLPATLLGFFTVKIYLQLFAMSRTPRLIPLIFFIGIYSSAFFAFNTAVLYTNSCITAVIFGFTLFCAVCSINFFCFAGWYLNSTPLVYQWTLLLIAITSIGVHSAVQRIKMSNEQMNNTGF